VIQLAIAHTWRGEAIPPVEQATLELEDDGDLVVRVNAPWHGDPPPEGPPGPTPGLWDFEVVELFVLGPLERYLELEFGPRGHHLVLRLGGRRQPVEVGLELEYSVERTGDRWTGVARVPRSYLPEGPHRINAYAIHGVGEARRYLCWKPTLGDAPDFHRLEVFEEVELP
jgi:hypothetical protein